jgi:hypothetical protein
MGRKGRNDCSSAEARVSPDARRAARRHGDDFAAVRERFVTFMAGGFNALYSKRKGG